MTFMYKFLPLLCSELTKCQKNLSVMLVKIQKYLILNIIMIKFDGFFFSHDTQRYWTPYDFKNIMLNAARLAWYFVKLIARPVSFGIMLKPSNFISISAQTQILCISDQLNRGQINLSVPTHFFKDCNLHVLHSEYEK